MLSICSSYARRMLGICPGICRPYARDTPGICRAYAGHGICRHMLGICWAYARHVPGICAAYAQHMHNICRAYAGRMLGICQIRTRHACHIPGKRRAPETTCSAGWLTKLVFGQGIILGFFSPSVGVFLKYDPNMSKLLGIWSGHVTAWSEYAPSMSVSSECV